MATAGPAPATFVDGVAQMAVLDAARHSASHGGAWTDVELAATARVASGPGSRPRAPVGGSANDARRGCTVGDMAGARLVGCRRGSGEPSRTPGPCVALPLACR